MVATVKIIFFMTYPFLRSRSGVGGNGSGINERKLRASALGGMCALSQWPNEAQNRENEGLAPRFSRFFAHDRNLRSSPNYPTFGSFPASALRKGSSASMPSEYFASFG